MPRLSELSYNNRTDIRSAIFRFYGTVDNLCTETNLISFHEWNYFENQLSLFHSLRDYITTNNLNKDHFPKLSNVRQTHPLLFKHIQQYGGKKLLSRRLDMCLGKNNSAKLQFDDLNYGKFSLDFGIEIMEYVHDNLLQYDPPFEVERKDVLSSVIAMPSEEILVLDGREDLVEKVMLYGGFESVARRLGLYF